MPPSVLYQQALDDCTAHHLRSKTFAGNFVRVHARDIKAMIDRNGCKTLLDYGCGKGKQYEGTHYKYGHKSLADFWGVEVTKYDPAWAPFAQEPSGKYDMVVCTSTLCWIPRKDIPWVVDRLYRLAAKALYVSEKIDAVGKTVVRDPGAMPVGWSADMWRDALRREHNIEVMLATRDGATQIITRQKL